MNCPYCGRSIDPGEAVCPDCHEDLSALAHLEQEHVICYNQALALAREGYLDEARDKLLVAVAHSEEYLPAQRLLAKVYAAQQDWPKARASALRAAELAPHDRQTRELLDTIQVRSQVVPTATRRVEVVNRRQVAEGILASYQRDVLGAFAVGAGLAAGGAFFLSLLTRGRRRH
jgi:tetratricopeptide (TPR) repeat protein